MGTANHWGGPVTTGSQQYARLFAAHGWGVAYLSDPISPFHLVRPVSWLYNRHKFGLWLQGGERDLEGRLLAYNHLSLLPVFNAPLLRSRLAVRRSLDLSVPPLRRKLRAEGFGAPDLVWIDHLVFEGLPDRLPPAPLVYRMADDPELFPGPYPPALLRRLPHLLARSDLVVATAHRLVEKASRHRDGEVLYLPNGVHYDHFATPGRTPPDLAEIPRPRVLYVGSLEPWFDVDLVAQTARAQPRFQFVIVGPARIDLRPGPRPYPDIPAYMALADVGMVPFRITGAMEAVHPIKVYEYLAAGLPVVSTDWEELRHMQAPIARATTRSDFVQAIGAAVHAPGDRDAGREYARGNAWSARFHALERAMARVGA
ncbi:MAG: glycosyltransferase [Gemmatimonadota bacterium]